MRRKQALYVTRHRAIPPGLRFMLLEHFPYAIFYIERTHYIDVIRILHQRREIPTLLLVESDN